MLQKQRNINETSLPTILMVAMLRKEATCVLRISEVLGEIANFD